mmetsp:Transcript_27006/g.35232  ORF Transcript_27006/g.35232 Transcript_27006/m.35232 type:complete len:83 (+) Transcript_27006:51-299(+)
MIFRKRYRFFKWTKAAILSIGKALIELAATKFSNAKNNVNYCRTFCLQLEQKDVEAIRIAGQCLSLRNGISKNVRRVIAKLS